jgi:general secretion pathway protein C
MVRARLRTLLVPSACLLLAVAMAWVLGRQTPPGGGARAPRAPTAPVVEQAAPQVAASPDASGPSPDPSDVPHTRLPLRLLATVVREDPSLSLATVVDVDLSTQVLSEGERFAAHPDARIARIERARILIDNAGVREQLAIETGLRHSASLTPEQRERRRERARRLRALSDAGTKYREVLGEGERGGLLAEGDVSAVYEDGEIVGVQFDGIRPGGLYEKIGLRNGDVVTGINGVSLGDADAAAQVIGQVATADQLSVVVRRGDGAQETLVIPTPELRTSLLSFDLPSADTGLNR